MPPEAQLAARRLEPRDAAAAAGILGAAFRGNRLYRAALGFDEPAFTRYWEALVELALADAAARAWGVEAGGELAGVLLCGLEGFPAPARGARFLWRLLRGVGGRRWLGYLRFVAAYDRVMHRSAAERALEIRGLWLAVRPGVRAGGLGAALVRAAAAATRAEGRPLVTAFADAGNRPLLVFYRRFGFSVLREVPFAGHRVAILEWRVDRTPEARPCGA
jgi:GNAT superfamily N-acetyltransferase